MADSTMRSNATMRSTRTPARMGKESMQKQLRMQQYEVKFLFLIIHFIFALTLIIIFSLTVMFYDFLNIICEI